MMLCCKFLYFVFSNVIYFNWNTLIVAQANKEWDLFALLNANEPPAPRKKGKRSKQAASGAATFRRENEITPSHSFTAG